MWDIIGKACNQPLYKIWGPVTDKVVPYASESRLSTPEERADFAARSKPMAGAPSNTAPISRP